MSISFKDKALQWVYLHDCSYNGHPKQIPKVWLLCFANVSRWLWFNICCEYKSQALNSVWSRILKQYIDVAGNSAENLLTPAGNYRRWWKSEARMLIIFPGEYYYNTVNCKEKRRIGIPRKLQHAIVNMSSGLVLSLAAVVLTSI